MDGPDLRERRRHQTLEEIRDAALALFEEHGVEATTVDDIAAAAGVSPRTVYRHVATKERAVLSGHAELDAQVEAMLAGFTADRPLLDQLEEVWREVLRALDGGHSEAGRLLLRVRRLMRGEPSLRLAATALDEERADELVARLVPLAPGRPDPELAVRVLVEATSATVRVVLDRWAEARDDGREVDLLATYDVAFGLLRGLP